MGYTGRIDANGVLYFDDDQACLPEVISRNGEEYIRQPDGSYMCDFNSDRIYPNEEMGYADKATTLELKPDPVDHPSHYEKGCGFECIDVLIETQGLEAVKDFCLCNAMKYLYRHGRKNGDEDVRKARWYIDKYLELVEV